MPERTIDVGSRDTAEAFAIDEPGPGGACHEYMIRECPDDPTTAPALYASIKFQCGPIKECGKNGCQNEQLLAVVVDRLEAFQRGPFHCLENERALNLLGEALVAMKERTDDRRKRGVEGKSES